MLQKPGCDRGRKAKVMVCEDEFVVALDMQLMIEEFGFIVQGPYPSLKSAYEGLEKDPPDVALLDVSLKDGLVYPLADRLRDMGVPLVFHSGHVNDDEISERYPGAICCHKPVDTGSLKSALRLKADEGLRAKAG